MVDIPNGNERFTEFITQVSADTPHEALMKKYPQHFPNGWKSMYIPGFSVGDGWLPILDRMFEELLPYAGNLRFSQIKEKYATLRVYFNAPEEGYDTIDKIISKYIAEANKSCENDGKPANRYDDGWVVTLCDDCAKKEGKEKWKYEEDEFDDDQSD